MKKLIAISVVFVLLASVAFAADVGATVFGKVDLISGNTEKDSKLGAGGGMGRIDFSASAENDDGTFGGWGRLRTSGYGGSVDGWGLMWWKPIQQFKLQIGNNPDGIFDTSNVTRWGFYQVAGDIGIVSENHAWDSSPWTPGMHDPYSDYVFYGGEGGFGLFLTISPIDALAINVILPYGSYALAEDTFKKFLAQVTYDADGIGKFALTYQGGLGEKDPVAGTVTPGQVYVTKDGSIEWASDADVVPAPGATDPKVDTTGWTSIAAVSKELGGEKVVADPGKIFFAFTLKAIENLDIDLGFSYTFKVYDYQAPMGIGLGAKYDAGAFGVKARFFTRIAGSYKDSSGTVDIPVDFALDVLPYFAINDSLTAFLSAGFVYFTPPKGADEGEFSWHVAPYLQYGFDWSKGFFAGINLSSTSKRDVDDILYFKVPIGLYFSF